MLLGADPEFFLFSGEGKPVGAHKVFGTNKEVPGPARAFRDGYSVELNTMPSTCRGTLQNWFFSVFRGAREKAAALGLEIKAADFVEISLSELESAPEDLQQFGCDPAFSAYDGGNPIPIHVEAKTHERRYAGGHVHFSFPRVQRNEYVPAVFEGVFPGAKVISHAKYVTHDEWNFPQTSQKWIANTDNHPIAVKLLDLYCGLPVAYMLGGTEQYERRKVYGQAGEFRSQMKYSDHSLGIEYRVPGSTVWNTHVLPAFIMGVGREVLRNFSFYSSHWDEKIEDDLRGAINFGDTSVQEKLLKRISYDNFFTFSTLKDVKMKCGDYLKTFSYGRVPDSHMSWDTMTANYGISRFASVSSLSIAA